MKSSSIISVLIAELLLSILPLGIQDQLKHGKLCMLVRLLLQLFAGGSSCFGWCACIVS